MTNKNYCETNSACVFPICSGGIYSIAWKSHQKVLHLHTHTIFCTYFAIAHKINRTICLAGIYIYIRILPRLVDDNIVIVVVSLHCSCRYAVDSTHCMCVCMCALCTISLYSTRPGFTFLKGHC